MVVVNFYFIWGFGTQNTKKTSFIHFKFWVSVLCKCVDSPFLSFCSLTFRFNNGKLAMILPLKIPLFQHFDVSPTLNVGEKVLL